MAHYPRHPVALARPRQSPPLTSHGVENVRPNNITLTVPVKVQRAESKPQSIWVSSSSTGPPPPRPPRHPSRPWTAPHPSNSPSSNIRSNIQVLPNISGSPNLPTDPSERSVRVDAPPPPFTPPEALLAYSPTQHSGFLNRPLKPVQVDDDSTSTSSSSRRPPIPPLQYYTRPSTAMSRDQYDQLSRSTTLHSKMSLSIDRHNLVAETRSRSKSSTASSDAVSARCGRKHSLGWNAEDKLPITPRLSFNRIWTNSEVALSSPVTASTLNGESTSSFTVFEDHEMEVGRKEDSGAGMKLPFWGVKIERSKAKINNNSDSASEETIMEPKLSRFLTGSPSELVLSGSSVQFDVIQLDDEANGRRDETTRVGTVQSSLRIRGTMRRVWRSMVGRVPDTS